MPTRASLVILEVLLLLIPCGCGRGPGAMRVVAEGSGRPLPPGEVHFVEHGRRAVGVFVDFTRGGASAFEVGWGTVLVPTTPGVLEGPVWTGERASREQVIAFGPWPIYRTEFDPLSYGDLARQRFGVTAVWVLGTDPFILGLPAGKPRRTWRQYADESTNAGASAAASGPLQSFTTRYVVAEELPQPLSRLIVFSPDFWATHEQRHISDAKMHQVTLPKPLTVDEALDALAAAGGDPARLGTVETVGMKAPYDNPRRSPDMKADQERLMTE